MAILLVLLAFAVQIFAFNMGRLIPNVPGIKGVPGRVLDWIVILIGIFFSLPTLLLTRADFVPVAIWSVSWIGAYFIGNIPNKAINKVIFVLWFLASVGLMIWFMPE